MQPNDGVMATTPGICAAVVALAMSLQVSAFAQSGSPATGAVRVPFVGCASDGQIGPLKAPNGTTKTVAISPQLARRLAYYKAENGSGILAPRGWHCFGTYGSNGSNLYVSPASIGDPILRAGTWSGLTGTAVQVSDSLSGTSGRFEVARAVARVFPAHTAYVKAVIAEGLEPASSFPQGPYPGDKLTYRGNEIVEYVTPANQNGLGTDSYLKRNGNPISGVAILTGPQSEPQPRSKLSSLIHLSVRLPRNATDLGPAIIAQLERDATRTANTIREH